MPAILRVDMARRTATYEDVPAEYARLGGRALSAEILSREVPPRCDPLGPENKLVLAAGLLGGTAVTTSGRVSVGCKSPLTGGIKEANVGGQLGHKLLRLGIQAIVVEGAPAGGRWHLLRVAKDGARLEPADDLAGVGNSEAHARLLGGPARERCAVTIGPAGEQRLAGASVAVSDPEGRPTRHAARGGVGAVMGAKGLKAIVVDDSGTTPLKATEAEAYRQHTTGFSKTVLEDRRTQIMSKYGTPGVIRFVNREDVQSLPTRNHHHGRFAGADRISGVRIAEELGPARGGKMLPCMAGCVIKCAVLYNDPEGKHVTSALEFETIALLGPNLEIDDIDAVANLDRLCDDIGLDSIETGNAVAVAMDAGVLPWGDWRRVAEALEEVRRGTELGRILGNGTVATARAFGVSRIPAVKGQGLPAWEPRTMKGFGIVYATSPQGADHTAGMVMARNVTENTLLLQARHEQILQAAVDSVGLCQFSNPVAKDLARLLSARYGAPVSEEEVLEIGRRCLKTERAFNIGAGLGRDSERLPDFLLTEALPLPAGPAVYDLPDDIVERFWDF
ncbi:MAG: aldehyde ferredoxin oxidoreductase [Chloroflexi bacterium]|nr:aldehyde ferredoxin oxidoreductase [Chloroflexota bacterium]